MDRSNYPYRAFVLRLWPVEGDDQVTWRASLQCVSSGERCGFEEMEALFAYLRQLTRASALGAQESRL